MPMGTSVYPFCTHPETILPCTSKPLNGGVQYRVLKKSYSALSPCSQVRLYYHLVKSFILNVFIEPNLESGANIDCCKLYRDNRKEYERLVRESIREQLGI